MNNKHILLQRSFVLPFDVTQECKEKIYQNMFALFVKLLILWLQTFSLIMNVKDTSQKAHFHLTDC